MKVVTDWKKAAKIIHETVVKKFKAYSPEDLRFLALSLCGEAGEVGNLVKKEWRGDLEKSPDPVGYRPKHQWAKHLMEELADAQIYLFLCEQALLNIHEAACNGWARCPDLDEACRLKLTELLTTRWPEAAGLVEAAGVLTESSH